MYPLAHSALTYTFINSMIQVLDGINIFKVFLEEVDLVGTRINTIAIEQFTIQGNLVIGIEDFQRWVWRKALFV